MAISSEEFTIGWICAISTEYAVACELLDEEYQDNQILSTPRQNDSNVYTFGRIHRHKIVIACLPHGRYGITSAAIVASNLLSSFPAIRFALLVGIAGGAPSQKHDIRLGDVVVSTPTPGFGGFIQYDYGKAIDGDFIQTGYASPPPQLLLNAVTKLKGIHQREGHKIGVSISNMLNNNKRMQTMYSRPGLDTDQLYQTSSSGLEITTDRAIRDPQDDPTIHYGLVASANQLMKDKKTRDKLADRFGVICFEMEATGITDSLPCLVIRGICDYSDSHKNDIWQGYAAATAAAYAKELLEIVTVQQPRIPGNIQDGKQFDLVFSLQGVPLTKQFTGRPRELQELHEALLPAESMSRRKVCILRGMGGIGKTQLAVEFMRRYQAQFSAIFWLDGSSEDSLKTSLVQQLARLPLAQSSHENLGSELDDGLSSRNIDIEVQVVLKWLCSEGNDRWLLIFDNVDREFKPADPLSYDIRRYFPVCDHGAILITTRLSRLERLGSSLELKTVDLCTAKSIFKTWYKGKADETQLDYLLSKLDGLPLAIAQAAAFIQESGTTVKTYIGLYEKQWSELVQPDHDDETVLTDYGTRSIWTTWTISYNSVRATDEHAANLLLLWSCLNNNDLWYGIFEQSLYCDYIAQQIGEWLGDIASNQISFIKTMRTLRSYSIVEGVADDTDSYRMHGVLHNWIYFAKGCQLGNKLVALAVQIVGIAATQYRNPLGTFPVPRLLPHAETCYSRLDWLALLGSNQNNLKELRWLWKGIQGIGRTFTRYGKYEDAETLLLQASLSLANLALHSAAVNTTVPDFLAVMLDLSILYILQHRIEAAEKQLDQILQLASFEDSEALVELVAQAMHHLGLIHFSRGKLKYAENVLLQARQECEKLEDGSIRTLPVMKTLGVLYIKQGRLDNAEEILTQALKGYDLYDPENPDTIFTVTLLGRICMRKGRYDSAEKFYLRSLGSIKESFGITHPLTLSNMNSIGTCYHCQGKLDQAEEILSQALAGHKKKSGELYTSTVAILSNIYISKGDLQEAQNLCLQVMESKTELHEMNQSDMAPIKEVLGDIHARKGRWEEALQCTLEALDSYFEILHPEGLEVDLEVSRTMMSLGKIYSHLSRVDEAKDMYSKALYGYTKALGHNSSKVMEISQLLHALELRSTASTSEI